jgi:uncharacterized protein
MQALRAAVRTIGDLCGELAVIGLDEPLARAAGELAEHHALRGYDAVHLASATAVAHPDLVMATWDRDLASAAVARSLTVVPAEH